MANQSSQLTTDLATLREIRERIDKAIVDGQRVAFDARANEVREAVKEAVADLCFHGGKHAGKTPQVLAKIVALLAPEVAAVLENEGAREAYRIVVLDEDED
jgi:hypothetical protein